MIPNFQSSLFELVTGANMDHYFDRPHLRWHKSFEEYPDHLSDIDDPALDVTDTFERVKPYLPSQKNVVGSSPIIPR